MSENKKCVIAYTIDLCNAYRIGTVIDTESFESDPTYFSPTGYDTVVDKYVVETAAGKEFLDSDELFAEVDDGLRVQVKGPQDQSQTCEVFWQDEGEVFQVVRGPIPGGEPDCVCV